MRSRIVGEVNIVGDKSISHRAIILSSLAFGKSILSNSSINSLIKVLTFKSFVKYMSDIIFGEVLDSLVAPSKPPEAKSSNSSISCFCIAVETRAELNICGK